MPVLLPRLTILATAPGEWFAVIRWIDEDTGIPGELSVGPGPDIMYLVHTLTTLITTLAWPWAWLPRSMSRPFITVPETAQPALPALGAWAQSHGWQVLVQPPDSLASPGL